MGIDKETQPNFLSIVIEDNEKYIKLLKKEGKQISDGETGIKDGKFLYLGEPAHVAHNEAFYFCSVSNELVFRGKMFADGGETTIHFGIPLSETVLIDILQHAVKKFNKLKNALENLK